MSTTPTSSRLKFRRFIKSDGQLLYTLDNDPEVMRYINGGTPTSREIIETKILPTFINETVAHSVFGFWIACETESNRCIGWFNLRLKNADSTEATIGYRLLRDYWGKGYATEGARALIDTGFKSAELRRVSGTTYEENIASRGVMEKLGLRFIRNFRLDLADQQTAHFESTEAWPGFDVEYAVTKEQWLQK